MKKLTSILALSALSALASAQSLPFSYQGQLKLGGAPVSGTYDLTFRLYDAASGGSLVPPVVCVDNVSVTDGTFTASVDFGAVFNGPAPRFIEVSVRDGAAGDCLNVNGFTTLLPRQRITAAPLAHVARVANALSPAIDGSSPAVNLSNTGKVGIGTATPGALVPSTKLDIFGGSLLVSNPGDQADLMWFVTEQPWVFRQQGTGATAGLRLQCANTIGTFVFQPNGALGIGTLAPTHMVHIANGTPTLALQDADSSGLAGGQQVGYISYRDNVNAERGWIGYGSAGDPDLSIVNVRPSGDIVLNPIVGNVGIGTTSPTAKLEVHGDIRLGASGQDFALRGEQHDRTLRGMVNGVGTILSGSGAGFTVARTAVGRFTVTFSEPFTLAPTVVVTTGLATHKANLNTTLTSAVGIQITNLSGVDADGSFNFIVMGQ